MKPLRIVIAEDDCLISMLLAEMLDVMGHDVCATAATESETVAAADRCRPDLMIVDAGLGRGSGVSAVEEILRSQRLAHVLISGDPCAAQARRPHSVVVGKPFGQAELAAAIETALAATATV
jgi:two-component system, response regulator PdtaR